jgi:hypothetical protein
MSGTREEAMIAHDPTSKRSSSSRHERSSEPRSHAPDRSKVSSPSVDVASPAAGAHAAHHLTNEDATPGAGVLPSHTTTFGKEVDGAAG